MEKRMLKLMQEAVPFQNQPFSPNKFKSHVGKGFSGQLIPAETCCSTAGEEEPTSPKVSCMGRIKHKNRQRYNNEIVEGQNSKESYWWGFPGKPEKIRCGAPRPHTKAPERVSLVPDLSHTRRYASGRDTLAGFDWMAHVAPFDAKHQNIHYLNNDSEVAIPFSAPIIIGELYGKNVMDLKPRKEINLWKRRTMAQPRPLQVASLR